MHPADFIQMIAPSAVELQKETGIRASVTIAQGALETGWGAHVPANNLFGVKAFGDEPYVEVLTWEVYDGRRVEIMARFRSYSNILDSLRDHAQVLLQDRYAPVREASSAEDATQQLYLCGYATDPDYSSKLSSIIRTYELEKYDKEEGEMTKDETLILLKEHGVLPEPMPDWFAQNYADVLHGLIGEWEGLKPPVFYETARIFIDGLRAKGLV